MNKLSVFIYFLCIGAFNCAAQVHPTFQFTPSTINTDTNNRFRHWAAECIYYPSDFPGMPKCTINKVYLRVGKQPVHLHDYRFFGLKVRMKATSLSSYAHGGSTDSLLINQNGSIVARYDDHTVASVSWDSMWIAVPLNVAGFSYSGGQNFAVQITIDSFDYYPIYLSKASNSLPGYRMIRTTSDSAVGTSVNQILDIGFDTGVVMPTSAATIGNFKYVSLFPNPAVDGRFNVIFETSRPVAHTAISVCDAMGRELFSQRYDDMGSAGSKQIAMHGMASGMYFVKIEGDGASIVRSITFK